MVKTKYFCKYTKNNLNLQVLLVFFTKKSKKRGKICHFLQKQALNGGFPRFF